jgi:hypothetical protein
MPKKGQYKKNASKEALRQRAFAAKPQQKKNRAARNKARAQAILVGRLMMGAGKV